MSDVNWEWYHGKIWWNITFTHNMVCHKITHGLKLSWKNHWSLWVKLGKLLSLGWKSLWFADGTDPPTNYWYFDIRTRQNLHKHIRQNNTFLISSGILHLKSQKWVLIVSPIISLDNQNYCLSKTSGWIREGREMRRRGWEEERRRREGEEV